MLFQVHQLSHPLAALLVVLATYLETVHLALEVLVQSRVLGAVWFATLGAFIFTTRQQSTTTRVAQVMAAVSKVRLHHRIDADWTQLLIGWLGHKVELSWQRSHGSEKPLPCICTSAVTTRSQY